MNSCDLNILLSIKYILLQHDSFTYSKISDLTNLSNKTIRNSMNQVDLFLQQYDLILERKPGVGLKLYGSESNRSKCLNHTLKLIQHTKQFSSKSRKNILIYLLLTSHEALHMNELEQNLFVTRPSIYNDLHILDNYFQYFNIQIVQSRKLGIYLNTGEKRRRHCLLDFTFSMLEEDLVDYHQFPKIIEYMKEVHEALENQYLKNFILDACQFSNSHINENNLQRAILFLFSAIYRCKQHANVSLNLTIVNFIENVALYNYIKEHKSALEAHYLITLNEEEMVYIAAQLSSYVNTYPSLEDQKKEKISQIVEECYNVFQKQLFFFNKVDLQNSLEPFLTHALQSSHFDYDLFNPNSKEIQKSYPDLYEVSTTINPILKKYELPSLPDGGIANLTLIIATIRESYISCIKCCYISNASTIEIRFNIAYLQNQIPNIHIDQYTENEPFKQCYDLYLCNQPLNNMPPYTFVLPPVLDDTFIKWFFPIILNLQNKKREAFLLKNVHKS